MDGMTADHTMIVAEIGSLNWAALGPDELSATAWAYYYFSIQFRENLEAALAIHPDDKLLQHLAREECNTDNLSPWHGVAAPGEKMDHDEFMRRVLDLTPIDEAVRERIAIAGERYLALVRPMDNDVKAMSIASYECGGLEHVFRAILRAEQWDTPLLEGFRHFLVKHIEFDSDSDEGHGALAQHLALDHRVRPLWAAFRDLFIVAAPGLVANAMEPVTPIAA
jgi:hypothetical protein